MTIELLLIADEDSGKDGQKEMRGINQIFDLADSVLDVLEGKPVGSTAVHRTPAPEAEPRKPNARILPGRTLSHAGSNHGPYRIVESHDGGTGEVRFVVTDGRNRAECNSAEFARKVMDSLG